MTTNAGNGGFIWKRKYPTQFVSVPSLTGHEIENAFQNDPTWLYTSDGTSPLPIKMVFESNKKFSGLGLINHTIPPTATMEIVFYSDAFITPLYTTSIPYTIINTYKLFEEIQSEYVKLQIGNVTGLNVSIGELYLGEKFQFPHNFSWGYEEEFNILKDVDTTDDGIQYETPGENEETYEYSKLRFTFNDVNMEYFEIYKNLIRPGKKVFIPNFNKPECHFGIVPNKTLKRQKKRTGDDYSLEFWTDAIRSTTDV